MAYQLEWGGIMSNILHLIDGSTVEIPEERFMKFVQMLTHRGIKSVRFDNTILIVSRSNIIRIELGEEDGDRQGHETVERKDMESVVVPEVVEGTEDREGDGVEDRKDEPVTEEKPETPDEQRARVLAEMKEKSDCSNSKDHMGHEQIIHYQDVTITRKGAKSSLPSRRYFPVCSFCGLKQRYVKADSLTDEQKDNAKGWVN